MHYTQYNLATSGFPDIAAVIKDCPYGMLHLRCQDTGNKLAVLVEVFYNEKKGLTCRIAHSQRDVLEDLCTEPVSLKLCNREKNIYVVADVTVSPELRSSIFSQERLIMAVKRLSFFKKNRSQQMVAYKL